MARIVAIVEGHGEVEAVPILLRRIAQVVAPDAALEIPRPIRVKRQRLLKQGELERAIELAARLAGGGGCILVLLDADSDCPKTLAPQILARAKSVRRDRTIRVVLAKREYESWFLAAAGSLAGSRGIREDVIPPDEPEAIVDPKGWLTDRMTRGRAYRETLDQPALTAVFDLASAKQAPSFEKMLREVGAELAER